jgi:plastocyanin
VLVGQAGTAAARLGTIHDGSRRRTGSMHVPRRRGLLLLAALVLLLTVGLSACGDTGAAQPGDDPSDATVTVATFSFAPDPLVVPVGTEITFVNEDAIDHTVTAGTREAPEPERFDGQLPEKGSTFELTLDEPGSYDYFCQIHPGPGMTATITVEP